MKEYEVKMVFDLTKPDGTNLYNSIRSLDGIKNAISVFKQYLIGSIKEVEELKGKDTTGSHKSIEVLLPKLNDVLKNFDQSFKDNGITV